MKAATRWHDARLAGRYHWRGWFDPKIDSAKQNARAISSSGGLLDISLTMSYFHTGTRTIIGAEAFHFPVRDGKEWDHLAMVIRLNWLPGSSHELPSQFIEIESTIMIAANRGQTRFDGQSRALQRGDASKL